MVIQAIGILLLVVGVVWEFFRVGSQENLGTLIAVLGVAAFVAGVTR